MVRGHFHVGKARRGSTKIEREGRESVLVGRRKISVAGQLSPPASAERMTAFEARDQ